MKSLIFLAFITQAFAADWPQWRGPTLNNKAAADATPVTKWSTKDNVRWKTKLPGRGHSTPIVVGKKIFLTTSEFQKGTQSLLCLERKTGKILWKTEIHKGGLAPKIHRENSHASCTPVWDANGEKILCTFQNEDKVKVTAVSTTGKIIWSKAVLDYKPNHAFGYGSTPVLHRDQLIVASDTKEKGAIVAIDTNTGKEKWRTPRSGHDNWASPVVATVAGKEQLLISGLGKLSSYDPATGKSNWTGTLIPESTCGTVVWTDDMVFASGGFPKNQTVGIKADGSSKVVWKNKERSYEQSLLSHNGLIYAITDQCIAICWRAEDGKEMWKQRIGRGNVMASPTLAGDHIYASLKNGRTTIFKATGESFQKIAENKLGDDAYASPVMVDDQLFLRVGFREKESRQEILYCLGVPKK